MKFEIGKSYWSTFVCDCDRDAIFKVISRTAKTIKVQYHNEILNRRVSIINGIEAISPFGNYSMSMTLWADKIV